MDLQEEQKQIDSAWVLIKTLTTRGTNWPKGYTTKNSVKLKKGYPISYHLVVGFKLQGACVTSQKKPT